MWSYGVIRGPYVDHTRTIKRHYRVIRGPKGGLIGSYWVICEPLESYGNHKSHMGTIRVIWGPFGNQMCSYGDHIWSYEDQMWSYGDHMWSYGDHMRLYGDHNWYLNFGFRTISGRMGLYVVIWDHLWSYGIKRDHMGTIRGSIWGFMGTIWGPYGVILYPNEDHMSS